MDIENRRQAVRKSLRYSLLDGSAYSVVLGLTQNYITPLALELKATTTQIGLLSSIPALIMALAQLAVPDLSARAGSRKGFILPVVFGQAVMFIPILLVHYVFNDNPVWWLIAFVTTTNVLGAIVNPAWGSMMADLVPDRLRGRYFGARGTITGAITLVSFFIAGVILQYYAHTNIFTGYSILLGGATFFRLLSFYFLSRQYEPVQAKEKEDSPGLIALIKNLTTSNLGKFTLYVSLIDMCTNVSAPFFTVFMRRDLQFSYLSYVAVSVSSQISNMLFLTYWGRRADMAGNMKVVRVTSILLPFVPILWLASTNVFYLMAANVFSGFVWSGYGLSAINFLYDASAPEIRTKQIAVFNAVDLIACCIGAAVGGYITPHLPVMLGYQLRTIFTVSGVLRGLTVLLLLRHITEVRRVSGMTAWEVLKGRQGNGKR